MANDHRERGWGGGHLKSPRPGVLDLEDKSERVLRALAFLVAKNDSPLPSRAHMLHCRHAHTDTKTNTHTHTQRERERKKRGCHELARAHTQTHSEDGKARKKLSLALDIS